MAEEFVPRPKAMRWLQSLARAAPRRFKNFGPPIVAVAKARGIGCDRSVRKWVRQPQTAGSANPEGGAATIDKRCNARLWPLNKLSPVTR
jgi:transposase-like protein